MYNNIHLQPLDTNNIIIPEGRLGIDLEYGRKILTHYLFELDQIQAGIDFKELGIGERRAASMPTMMDVPNDKKPFLKDRIAVVNLNGMIQADDGMSSYGTRSVGDKLVSMKKDVIGAVLKINSGGGYMDGAEAMIAAMREFGKPIVVNSSFAGSAAYMIGAEANQIFAQTEYSEFGSIGVYIELGKKFKEMYKEYVDVAYSEKSPNKNKAFRDYIENNDLSGFVAKATERDLMFMAGVSKNRNLDPVTKEETLSGGMFSAKDSIKRGLIDGIASLEKSILTVQKLSRLN